MLGKGDRDEGNTQKISDYDMTIDLYVANIDKNLKKTWRTIYKAIDERYFVEVRLFPRSFINICKNHTNDPQNIPTDIKKSLKIPALEEILYAQVVRICRKSMVQKEDIGKNLK